MNNNMEIQREAIIEIVGTQYDGRIKNHYNLVFQQKLVMMRQSDNYYDHNAILILTADGKELGYIPKGYASLYAPAMDSGKYNFVVEVIKAEYDYQRPILIVKIISELNSCSEKDVEKNVLQLVRNIIACYNHGREEYLSFICSDSVLLDYIILALDRMRLLQKLYSVSDDIIKHYNIEQNNLKSFLSDPEYSFLTKETLNKVIDDLKVSISDVLKKIQKSYNESLDIDDDEEYHRVQSEIRERRKVFRSFDDLINQYREVIDNHVSIDYTQLIQNEESVNESKIEVNHNNVTNDQSNNEVVQDLPDYTEQTFFNWLVCNEGLSDLTAKQYISNIHSTEKLYQTIFGARKNLLGTNSADDAKLMIETLITRSEYIDANKRRHNSFGAALNKFIKFAGISVEEINTETEKKSPESSELIAVDTVEYDEDEFSTPEEDLIVDLNEIENDLAQNDNQSLNTITKEQNIISEEIQKPMFSESVPETVVKNEIPEIIPFVPDTTNSFKLKDAVIEILLSDANVINECREYKNGISSKKIRELLKEYYGKVIGVFEISKLLMMDKTFQSVGKGCYIVNPAMIIKESVVSEAESDNQSDEINYVAKSKAVELPVFPAISSTPFEIQYESKDKCNVTIEKILEVIKENSDSLQYEDGFSAYEIKSLLFNRGIFDVSEDVIEHLMSECSELSEIEDGYYVLMAENVLDKNEQVIALDEDTQTEVDVPKTSLENIVSKQPVSGADNIIIRLNGNMIRAYDCSDALNKICEFAINYKPFMMAHISDSSICINGVNVFYRQSVPVDGYNYLSNGLQVLSICIMTELKIVTNEIMKYCQIDDNMITIVSE